MSSEFTQNLLENLNKQQLEAVLHEHGPLLIIAGAGTGKTTAVTQKIAYLIEQGKAKQEEILALTFTEKAAGEMEDRVVTLLPYGAWDLWISTFHSFGDRILKDYGLEIGLPPDFKLLNQFQIWALVRKNLEKFNLDYYKPLGNPTKFIHTLLRHFSRLKDEEIWPEDYLKYAEELRLNLDSILSGDENQESRKSEANRISEVANAYHTYQKLLLDSEALDFGDLINYTLKLFKMRPRILEIYRKQFKYIIIDEFQDTNWAQYELVKLLAEPKNNLTVVGDDDQSIFRFRGASMSNILQFKKDYPKSKNIVLTDNYRSNQNILDKSYDFIALNNPNRLECHLDNFLNKKLKAHQKGEGTIEVLEGASLDEEIKLVLDKILELKSNDINWSDFAVLVRANSGAPAFMHSFEKAGIPYLYLASRGLYTKPVIMNTISYLKLLDNYHESGALFRILLLDPFKIDYKDVSNLSYWANRKSISLFEALKRSVSFNFSEEALVKFKKVFDLIEKHSSLARDKNISEIIMAFFTDCEYLKSLTAEDNQENRESLNYLNQFYKKVVDFERANEDKSIHNFLDELELEISSGETGAIAPDFSSLSPDSVKILTVHAAKGLEFKYVFIVNLVDKRFPATSKRESIEIPDELIKEILPQGDSHLEEERRLFYVAMTRARSGLFMSWGRDYGGAREKRFSRFLEEAGLVKSSKSKYTKVANEKKKDQAFNLEISDSSHWQKNVLKTDKELASEKNQFSFSQLEAFRKCPYQYRFNYILKVPTPGSAQFSFGKTMHSAMQKIMERVLAEKNSAQVDLFGNTKKDSEILVKILSLKEALELFEASWIDDWYENRKQREEYHKKGRAGIKNFYQKYQNEHLFPFELEKNFNMRISAKFYLRGAIDRVDEFQDGLKIIDYKTGNPKIKLGAVDKEQLFIYQLASAGLFEKPIKKLAFYYLDNGSELDFLGNDKDLEKTESNILKTIEQIKKGDFSPCPSELCKFCDFRGICEFKKV